MYYDSELLSAVAGLATLKTKINGDTSFKGLGSNILFNYLQVY